MEDKGPHDGDEHEPILPPLEDIDLPAVVKRLSKDLAAAARTISDAEARFLVDAYYTMQDGRIRADGQVRSIEKNPVDTGEIDAEGNPIKRIEPHDVLTWLSDQNWVLETQVKRALARYVEGHPVGEWLTSIYGIGPVISAGLLAHIDITRAPAVGHIWRFAGLDPTLKWLPKTKRPWNAGLKVLCWKAGESFVKFSNKPDCYYGHVWRKRKDLYIARNEAGNYVERCKEILSTRNYKKDTDAYANYSVGKLPPAHIHAMARRYAVKLFLAHLHHVMYVKIMKTEPPLPYPIAFLNHVHYIPPPGYAQ
jgi:hypothetical protein